MIDLLLKRRSIRHFKDQDIKEETITKILQAALLSPSSRNIKPWEFIVVTDKNTIQILSQSKSHGSQFLADAPLAIVVIANIQSDVWIEDCSIASILIQLETEEQGLGSCWAQIRNRKTSEGQLSEDYIKEKLDIPYNFGIESIIGIGYRDEEKSPNTLESLDLTKIHYNKF